MLVLGMWAGLIAGPESTAPPSVDDERAARAEVEMLIRAAQEKSDKEVNRILGPPTRMRKAPDAAWEMLFPALLVEDSYLREVMLKALQDPGLATAHDLSGLLRNVVRSSRDRNIRLRIVELLKKIGAASLPALTEVGSMDSDPEIRRAAATASGPFREEREALSRRMWTAVNQGRFVEARKAAQELLATFPRDPEATRLHQRLGAVCGVLGNQAGNGDQARALRRSALGYLGAGETDRRQAYLCAWYASHMEPPPGLLIPGPSPASESWIKHVRRDCLDLAVTEGSKDERYATIVEQKLTDAARYHKVSFLEVIPLCEDVLLMEPENVQALRMMGSAHYALGGLSRDKGDTGQAKAHFLACRDAWVKVLQLRPEDAQIQKFLKSVQGLLSKP